VRGVIKAVHVVSPVESSSPPRLSLHYDSLLRPCRKFGKCTFYLAAQCPAGMYSNGTNAQEKYPADWAAHDQERLFAQDSTRVGQTLPFRQVSFGGGIFWIGAQKDKLKPVLLYKHAFAELVAADEHLGRAIAAEQIRNLAILKNALRLKRAGCRN
jgi:hypothetical protein